MSRDLALKKLEKESKELNSKSGPVQAMKAAVYDALVMFCVQDEEFAQAVVQGGSFADCMAAVAKDVGSAISDLDAYRRAVRFYFPGADIRFQMRINLCADAEAAQAQKHRDKPKVLDLFELM